MYLSWKPMVICIQHEAIFFLFCSLSTPTSWSCSFQWRCAMLLVMSQATSPSLLLRSHLPTLLKVLHSSVTFHCGFFFTLSMCSCFIITIQLWSPSSTRPLLSLSLDSRFPWLCGCPLPLLSSVIFNSILWYDVLLKLPITVPIASVNATSLGWRTLLHIPTFTSLCVLTFDTIGIFLV